MIVTVLAVLLAGCGSNDDENQRPDDPTTIAWDQPPTELRWDTYQGMRVPAGAEGPTSGPGADAAGYQQSPPGAALAAIGATIRMSVAPDDQWHTVAASALAAGPGRDAWMVSRVRISITDPVPAAAAPTVVAYQVTHFDGATATIAVFTRQADQSMTRNIADLVWVADPGTWQLVLPAGDGAPSRVTAVDEIPADTVRLDKEG